MSKFHHRGGVRIGLFNASWPLATLDIDESRILVRVLRREYDFQRDSIRALNRYSGLLSNGVQIQHFLPEVDKLFIFWTFSPGRVYENITACGYDLEAGPPTSL